jgi:hypothetical protein
MRKFLRKPCLMNPAIAVGFRSVWQDWGVLGFKRNEMRGRAAYVLASYRVTRRVRRNGPIDMRVGDERFRRAISLATWVLLSGGGLGGGLGGRFATDCNQSVFFQEQWCVGDYFDVGGKNRLKFGESSRGRY